MFDAPTPRLVIQKLSGYTVPPNLTQSQLKRGVQLSPIHQGLQKTTKTTVNSELCPMHAILSAQVSAQTHQSHQGHVVLRIANNIPWLRPSNGPKLAVNTPTILADNKSKYSFCIIEYLILKEFLKKKRKEIKEKH